MSKSAEEDCSKLSWRQYLFFFFPFFVIGTYQWVWKEVLHFLVQHWPSLISNKPQLQGAAARLGQREGWTDGWMVALVLLWRETSVSGPGNLTQFNVQRIQ